MVSPRRAAATRHNSGGPIAPQLGRFHKKVTGGYGNAGFFGGFPCDSAQMRGNLPKSASLATGVAMRETMPGLSAFQAQDHPTGDKNMAGTVEQKLAAQGITLPEPTSPVANYVPFVRSGNLLFVSGQVCFGADGKLIAKGKLGAGVTLEQGAAAARGCAINLLAQVKAALGDLDKVVRVVRLGGFINSAPDFLDGPKVLNGASDLMVAAFGDKGRHARTTVGVASLPADAAVEVEGVFEVA
jgi:enamine deaminase RidA (YjgF/YER057c/UK114 family)